MKRYMDEGTTLKLRGGGQTSPGVQGNPYPKLKTPPIWPTIFWEFTCKKMNDTDSPKLAGGAPTASKLWWQVASTAAAAPASLLI